MAVYSVINPTIFVGHQDLSGDLSSIDGTITANPLDVTTFGSGGWHQRIAGLKDVDLSGDGFLNLGTGNVEEYLYTVSLGAAKAITIGPTTGAEGTPAELFQGLHTTFDQPEKVGDAAAFKMAFKGTGQVARGIILTSKTAGTTSSGSGTITVSQAVVATASKLYATLHVFSVSGTNPTLTVSVLSGTTSGFGSSTSRIAFSTATAASSQWGTPAVGPITDQFYRTSWTIGGTSNPTFSFAVGLGFL